MKYLNVSRLFDSDRVLIVYFMLLVLGFSKFFESFEFVFVKFRIFLAIFLQILSYSPCLL